jgi:hypothetical protein
MQCTEGQPFGGNYNESYAASGLKGHTGQDWGCGFGTPIHTPFAGLVYKVLTKENPSSDGSGFTGVFMLVDNGLESFEWLVGHCDPTVKVGDQVNVGDVIGTEANHGTVFAGNIQITLAMQAAGDQRGHHRHEQKRPYMKTKSLSGVALSIEGGGMYRDADGFYYQVFDYKNGFNGCVDPSLPVFIYVAGAALVVVSAIAAFSDERLKRDIEPVGSAQGLTLYKFRYLWDDTVYVGVMAQ